MKASIRALRFLRHRRGQAAPPVLLWRLFCVTASLALLLHGQTWHARAQDKGHPLLSLDTGGHKALIRGLAFTPDGRHLLSAGDDKAIRVWDWRAGAIVRTIRAESDSGRAGRIFALALSPDGNTFAVGGYLSANCPGRCGDVRVHDFATGEIRALLQGYSGTVTSLAFSPNGRQLVAGGSDGTALVWDISTTKVTARLPGHGNDFVYGVGFSPDGSRVATGGYDGLLHLWRVSDGAKIATLTGHKGKVRSLAISPLDGTIASGDTVGEIRIWNGGTGRPVKSFGGGNIVITSLSFTPDGKRLVAGVSKPLNPVPPFHVNVWNVAKGVKERTFTAHDQEIFAVAAGPDGRVAASAGGQRMPIHVWDLGTGKRLPGPGNAPLTLQGVGSSILSVGFFKDGKHLLWGRSEQANRPNARGPLEWALRLPDGAQGLDRPRRLSDKERTGHRPVTAVARKGELSLAHRQGGDPVRPFGVLDLRSHNRIGASVTRTAATGYSHLSYTFAPTGRTIISGGANGLLLAYDLLGKDLGAYAGHEGDVLAVAASPDGRFLVSGSEDQTVRLWNIETRELIVSLFQGGTEWILWTPQGYYHSSDNGDRFVGWQVNRGPDKTAEYHTARQLRQHFFRPDIVERAIILASATKAVAEAKENDPARMAFDLDALLDRKRPAFTILAPADGARLQAATTDIEIRIDGNPDAITRLQVLANGREMTPPAARGLRPIVNPGRLRKFPVSLGQGENRITVKLSNDVGEEEKHLSVFGSAPGALDEQGELFVVAIGVDRYPHLPADMCVNPRFLPQSTPGSPCDLDFAGKDARAFHDEFIKASLPLYKNVQSIVLANNPKGPDEREPTLANISDALDLLSQAGNNDTSVLFLSGHGVNDSYPNGRRYLFLPTDAQQSRPGAWRSSSIFSGQRITEAFARAGGTRLAFVDTCHAANSYSPQFAKSISDEGISLFAATGGNSPAFEHRNLGSGIFTHVVIRALRGENAPDGEVRLFRFADFVAREVEKLSGGVQRPDIRPNGINYLIARIQR